MAMQKLRAQSYKTLPDPFVIPYVKRRATIRRSLIFNTNSFASKFLILLTKIVYMYLKVVLGKVFQQ